MSSFSTNAKGGRWRHSPTAGLITHDPERLTLCWCVISVRRRTIWKWIRLMLNCNRFAMILWSRWFLSRRIRSPVWIHCCKRPNYDFCVSQGSVTTILSRLRQAFPDAAFQKLSKSVNVSRSYSKNKSGTFSLRQCITNLPLLWGRPNRLYCIKGLVPLYCMGS